MNDYKTITSLLGGIVPMPDLDTGSMALILNSLLYLSTSLRASDGAEKTPAKNYWSDSGLISPTQTLATLATLAIRHLMRDPKFHKDIEEAGGDPKADFESVLTEIFAASISSKSVDSFVNALTTRLLQDPWETTDPARPSPRV